MKKFDLQHDKFHVAEDWTSWMFQRGGILHRWKATECLKDGE